MTSIAEERFRFNPNISPPIPPQAGQRPQRESGSEDPASDRGRESSRLLRREDSGTPGISGFFRLYPDFATK